MAKMIDQSSQNNKRQSVLACLRSGKERINEIMYETGFTEKEVRGAIDALRKIDGINISNVDKYTFSIKSKAV